MSIKERVLRHRKDTRWIVAWMAALLAVLSAIYYAIQRGKDIPSELVANRVLLFALQSVNVLLILVILAVLTRNLVKMALDSRRRILGSKFRIKLVATYIGLSLLPVLLLFAYGTQLLQGWIDRWFSEPAIEQVLRQGDAVAQALHGEIQKERLHDADLVLSELGDLDLNSSRSRLRFARRMEELLTELSIDFLALYEEQLFVHGVVNSQSGIPDLPDVGSRFLEETMREGQATQIREPAGTQGRLIIASVADRQRADRPLRIAVTGTLLDPAIARRSEQLIQTYQGYRQLKQQKAEIQRGYVLIFLMVTLLLLLTSSWVGLYLARRVTEPIRALADGTRRISRGDLDYRVEVAADDELGVLVDSFNRMTNELSRNKQQLLSTNERLEEERTLVSAVLGNMDAGVISVDDEGRILTCNEAALKMLGERGESILARPIRDLWPHDDRRKLAELFDTLPSQDRGVLQLRLIVQGEWKTFEAKLTVMRDREKKVTGKVMVIEDLTELLRAQQVAAWNEAARRVAHEIKNPLTPIKLSAERLLRKYRQAGPELGKLVEESVEIISREVESMKAMVDEFSRFARMRSPQPIEVDLSNLFEETIHLYDGLKPGLEINARVDRDAARAHVDREQFKSVLINLLDNAVHATNSPGSIDISAHKKNGNLEIAIADTGAGISSEAKAKLFLPHFSTKGRGTGLGLSIVYRIVTDHHGSIRVEDNRPHGTIFRIRLPQQ